MKIRTDFVTNSSSSNYVFIGFYSKELLDYLHDMIDMGYTYRLHGEETLATQGYIATNSGTTAVVDALTYIRDRYTHPEILGFQIEMQDNCNDKHHDEAQQIMRFIDPEKTTEAQREEILNNLNQLIAKAKEKGQILWDFGRYSTDADDFADHFSVKNYDTIYYEITPRGKVLSCKNPELEEAFFYSAINSIDVRAFENMKKLKKVFFYCFTPNIIHSYAFAGCESLESIGGDVAFRLRKIGTAAFLNCKKLKEIAFESFDIDIGSRAFEGCESLTKVILPKKIKKSAKPYSKIALP